MKDKILQLVAAFLALLHTEASDTDAIATLKGQIADLQTQLSKSVQFSDDDIAQINSAVNQIAAAPAPSATATAAAATVVPDPGQSASDIPDPTDSVPADVAQAAATTPPPATSS
jgi:hypothetical protein